MSEFIVAIFSIVFFFSPAVGICAQQANVPVGGPSETNTDTQAIAANEQQTAAQVDEATNNEQPKVEQVQTKKLTATQKRAKKAEDKMAKKIEQADEANVKRYVLIAKDNRFFYYIDKQSARWIMEPNSNQKILDVWLKLRSVADSTNTTSLDSAAPIAEEYLLDHYYIRPQSRQIQFLCELEVVGQPSNDIKQNVYSVKNWEDIIPGSVEENIYNAVVSIDDSFPQVDNSSTGTGVGLDGQARDFLDRVLNISL